MFDPILTSETRLLWYAIPIIVAISLVYGATRHELLKPILMHAYHTAVWIVGFMFLIMAILFAVSWFV